ncbi:RICIN domain-containing protein [Lentzea nigeriaca]|uniref:RICIN domain-containing protein n=1 Tax=Lentzea nigeriaca TaxID=1128665 RepID=UPI00195D2FCC|nr:RICIN domain-containing protein [Lentzea nigeriaca]MBM7861929.1 hypothetical protein [Lentzea nigeriaca]
MRKKAAICAALVLIAGGIVTTTTASAVAAVARFQISSRYNNRCLTVSDFNTANGAGVLMVDCQGAASQLWSWEPEQPLHLRNAHSNKCLTAAWGNGDNGAALHMWDCQRDWGSQMFYLPGASPEEDGRVRTMRNPNRCVEISGANWWQGANVQLWDCASGGGTNHQRWNVPTPNSAA